MTTKQETTATADSDRVLREQLLQLLDGKGAHVAFEKVIADFPVEAINGRVEHIPYTPWQVLEHMRIAQWDILQYGRDAEHVSPPWPEGYWPAPETDTDDAGWQRSVEAFRADLKAMKALVEDSATDLFAPVAQGIEQTVLRKALLIADPNAYHLGVLSTLKRILLAQAGDK